MQKITKTGTFFITAIMILATGCNNSTTSNPTGSNANQASISLTSNAINDCSTEIAKIKFTKSNSTAAFSTDIVTPQSFTHNPKIITLDLTDFTNGGTLNISGKVGANDAASIGLAESTSAFTCTGYFVNIVANATNTKANESFNISYKFTGGKILSLAAEGSWGGPKGTNNNVSFNFSVN